MPFDAPIMWVSDIHCDAPIMGVSDMPCDRGTTYHCKLASNIDIYPSTVVLVENIGHKYGFQGGGVVSGKVWGRGWSRSKEKISTEY